LKKFKKKMRWNFNYRKY